MTLKQFKLSNEEDFIYYLRELILLVHKHLEVYKERISQLELYIETHKLIEKTESVISPKIYEDFRSRLIFTSNYLLNAFGDQSDLGISYQNYRRLVKKKNIKHLFLKDEDQSELNNLTTLRDWSAHIPASILHSTEVRAKGIKEVGPIYYPEFESFQGLWLVSLYEQSYNSLQTFIKWKSVLKREYEFLTGEICVILPFSVGVRNIDDLQIAKISWLIQDKKIKSVSEIKGLYVQKESD